MFRLEHGDKVLVAELILWTVRGDVMGVLGRSLAGTYFVDTIRCQTPGRNRRPNG